MKKTILLTLIIFSSFKFFSQGSIKDVAVISIVQPILYSNYPHDIKIGNNFGHTNYRVEGKNAVIQKDSVYDSYILIPAQNADLDVEIYFIDNQTSDTFSIQRYDIELLPRAHLYLGSAADGESLISRTSSRLSARFGEEIPLRSHFSIDNWIVTITGQNRSISGSGDILSTEAMSIISQATKGSVVAISCKISNISKTFYVVSSVFKL